MAPQTGNRVEFGEVLRCYTPVANQSSNISLIISKQIIKVYEKQTFRIRGLIYLALILVQIRAGLRLVIEECRDLTAFGSYRPKQQEMLGEVFQ